MVSAARDPFTRDWRTVVGAWIALGEHAHTEDFPEPEALRGITAPTLILSGDRDRFFPAAMSLELYGLLPDAELCILPGTGHNVPSQRPEWTNEIVLEFLARRGLPDRYGPATKGA